MADTNDNVERPVEDEITPNAGALPVPNVTLAQVAAAVEEPSYDDTRTCDQH